MKIYINGMGNVSPQRTWDQGGFLEEVQEYGTRMIQCMEPAVDPGLDEKYLRRMNRLLRLGWIAAKLCLEDAANGKPDAIITGSGWGSVHDSEKFLLSIYRNKENLLPPTPFIQSTHNALGSQIAILLGNFHYNIAYAHASFAFEHALTDSMLRLKNGDSRNVLTGGFDEITANQFLLFDRLCWWRKEPVSNLRLYETSAKGSISGEGFTFFILNGQESEKTYAEVKDVMTLFSVDNKDQIARNVLKFLERNGLEPGMIDWVFTGLNGDSEGDRLYSDILAQVFPSGTNQAAWKHLCGEYLTSTAFATWACAKAIRQQAIPDIFKIKTNLDNREIKNILIYNHSQGMHHSFILLSSHH